MLRQPTWCQIQACRTCRPSHSHRKVGFEVIWPQREFVATESEFARVCGAAASEDPAYAGFWVLKCADEQERPHTTGAILRRFTAGCRHVACCLAVAPLAHLVVRHPDAPFGWSLVRAVRRMASRAARSRFFT